MIIFLSTIPISLDQEFFLWDHTVYQSLSFLFSGNPARYQSRGVIRMNRGDTKPFEDQRLGVPGTGTESEADQHLRGMVQNQLDTNVTLERYDVM